jgi:outer membrane receptor protein involved in Fe transport
MPLRGSFVQNSEISWIRAEVKQPLLFLLVLSWLGLLLLPAPVSAAGQNDTMLMFVGEDLSVLSIASRREESARQAPAIACVIPRETFRADGSYTLTQALSKTPGFYMAQKEWGTQPYLRGTPDSILLLYDTVPLLSDMTKATHPLDEELSLAPVKRIEIVRGPGSVLWGPDAFAGIVNIVPLTGKDVNGVETGVDYGHPGDPKGFYLNAGHDGGAWNAFISISGREAEADERVGNVVSFWDDGIGGPVPAVDRYGDARPDKSHYLEFNGNFDFKNCLTVTGRFSDYTRPYSMSDQNEALTWVESRSTPVNFVKIESCKDLDSDSALRFTGYYSSINSTYKVIDLEFEPRESTGYGEAIYDRNLWSSKGLLTMGTAFRKKWIDNAPIWDSYLPDFLEPTNETFLPSITEKDYDTDLWSIFTQYTHKIDNFDLSFGVRRDTHNEYKDRYSYNTGLVWSPSSVWTIKALYGTAYRTPFARQLIEDEEPELEKINTLNLKVGWQPTNLGGLSVCGFVSRLSDHIMEDPYAGLSTPNHQKIQGVELEGWLSPLDNLEFKSNLTVLDNSGPDERYHYSDYFIQGQPGQPPEKHYTDLYYPFDTGPKSLFNFSGQWTPWKRLSLYCRAGYFSSQDVICPRCTTIESVPGAWLVDATVTVRDIVVSGLDMQLYMWNLTDKDYRVPGTYSTIEGEPFSWRLMLTKRW